MDNISNCDVLSKKKRVFIQVGFSFFFLFCLFVFVSKASVNILGGIVLLIFIVFEVFVVKGRTLKNNPWLFVLLAPFALGLVLSFFSLGGVKGAPAFLGRYRWFLLVLPYTAFVRTDKENGMLLCALNVSAMAGLCYGVMHSNWAEIWNNFYGLHAVGRNSDLMISLCLLNLAVVIMYKSDYKPFTTVFKPVALINTALMIFAVIVMARRGSYLGLIVGGLAIMAFSWKRKGVFVIFSVLVLVLVFVDSPVRSRLITITDVEKDPSNLARIQLNEAGMDFLVKERLFLRGTGGKMAKKPFVEYFNSMPEDYRDRHKIAMEYAGNFHNSFLQMAVEGGAVFLAAYLASALIMVWRMMCAMYDMPGALSIYPLTALVLTLGFGFSQIFHNDFYSYGALPFILAFSAGCSATQRFRDGAFQSTKSLNGAAS